MVGVTLGALLLLLLIGLVVLQGLIEWGGFDFDKIIKKKTGDTAEKAKEIQPAKKKSGAKNARKKAAPKKKASPKKKTAKKKAAPKKKAAKGKGKK
ncbi:MAG: hypothetical protein ACLFP1_06875 [Candidatus Goldiibacteriota bacterium]